MVTGMTLAIVAALIGADRARADLWSDPNAKPNTISSPISGNVSSGSDSSGGTGSDGDGSQQLTEGVPTPRPAAGAEPPPGAPPPIRFLPGKFQMDTKTCSDPGDQEKTKRGQAILERATDKVDKDLIRCLEDINPIAAKAVRDAQSAKNPMLLCDGVNAPRDGREGGNTDVDKRQIFLTGADPFKPGGTQSSEGPAMDPATNSGATVDDRMTARRKAYGSNTIAALIFHELLHANKFSEGGKHDATNPKDEVYACHYTCGALSVASYEQCMTCAWGWGNKPSDEVAAMCKKQFPPMSMVADVRAAGIFIDARDKCVGGNNDACMAVLAVPQFEVCSKNSLAVKDAECIKLMTAEFKAMLERNMASPQYASLSDQVKAAYEKVKAKF